RPRTQRSKDTEASAWDAIQPIDRMERTPNASLIQAHALHRGAADPARSWWEISARSHFWYSPEPKDGATNRSRTGQGVGLDLHEAFRLGRGADSTRGEVDSFQGRSREDVRSRDGSFVSSARAMRVKVGIICCSINSLVRQADSALSARTSTISAPT